MKLYDFPLSPTARKSASYWLKKSYRTIRSLLI